MRQQGQPEAFVHESGRAEKPGGHNNEHHGDSEWKLAHHHPAPDAKTSEDRVYPPSETAAFRGFLGRGNAFLYSISHSDPPRRSGETSGCLKVVSSA